MKCVVEYTAEDLQLTIQHLEGRAASIKQAARRSQMVVDRVTKEAA